MGVCTWIPGLHSAEHQKLPWSLLVCSRPSIHKSGAMVSCSIVTMCVAFIRYSGRNASCSPALCQQPCIKALNNAMLLQQQASYHNTVSDDNTACQPWRVYATIAVAMHCSIVFTHQATVFAVNCHVCTAVWWGNLDVVDKALGSSVSISVELSQTYLRHFDEGPCCQCRHSVTMSSALC